MSKASASFLLFIISAMFISFQSYAQFQWQEPSSENVTERVQQSLRPGQRLAVSELLRFSPQEQRQMEVLSLSISAQSFRGPAQLEILALGRPVGLSQIVRRQLHDIKIPLPPRTRIADLELTSIDEIFIDTISLEIGHSPVRPQEREEQPLPQQMLSLRLQRDILSRGTISLDQLVKQQLGLTLEGAQIERVVVGAQLLRSARPAGLQIELNNRPLGPMRPVSLAQRWTPLPVNSFEEVRSLNLVINGDVRISEITIRIGQVRPIRGGGRDQRAERVLVNQQISGNRPLELSRLLPFENRLVRSIAVEARSLRSPSAEVALLSMYSEVLASIIVNQVPMRPVLQLMRPMSVRELTLQSLSSVMIDAIELEFDRSPRR